MQNKILKPNDAFGLVASIEEMLATALRQYDRDKISWDEYAVLVDLVTSGFDRQILRRDFGYVLPAERQKPFGTTTARTIEIPLVYYEWPGPKDRTIICLGGIANSGRRFDFLGQTLSPRYRIIALDWAGRGRSGWLPELADYHLKGHAWQVEQLIDHLGTVPDTIIGSSLGGATILHLHRNRPEYVKRAIFNDFGPFIPKARRQRRAAAIAKHYVFRQPADIFRRMGAAQKNSGPVGDAVLLHLAHHLTCWSNQNRGRVYRHDLRALLAFRQQAESDLSLWHLWENFDRPLLVLHGAISTSLENDTISTMKNSRNFNLVTVEGVGHTPSLTTGSQLEIITNWMDGNIELPSSLAKVTNPRQLFH